MKNPDLKKFTSKTNLLQFQVKISLKNTPLTSCEIERSFSLYKSILTDKKYNLLNRHSVY